VAVRRLALLFGAFIIVTGLVAATLTRSSAPARAPARPATTDPGADPASLENAVKALDLVRPSPQKLAQDFAVKTLEGRTVRLREHRGQVVFINFWATWCPPCREEMPAMERLFQRNRNNGLLMLAVSVDADPKVIGPFLEEHGLTFTVGMDPKMDLANAYGVRALPATFIIDREGYVAALALGPREWDSAASQALIEGLSRR
jgi:peroxiredoxin